MKTYMEENTLFSQAWNITKKGKWHYVATRANSWTWNDFYEYIAGVNLNYLFKLVSNNYLGEMISKIFGIASFDTNSFTMELSTTFKKIINSSSPVIRSHFVKAIVKVFSQIKKQKI